MSYTFTKLFSSITLSTIWSEPNETRLVWITMLAMADRKGRVLGSVPGLAHAARVSLDGAINALSALMAPDKFSRTKEHEGRRVTEIDGGWCLLNYAKYREMQDHETVKESKRRYIQERREKEKLENVDKKAHSRSPSIQAEAEAEAEEVLKDVFVSLRSTNNAEPPEVEENFAPEKPKKAAYSVPQCPYDKIVEAYSQSLPSLPQIAVISAARKRAMQARWRDVCSEDKMTADEALEFFRGFFAGVGKSKFLMGRANPGKDGRTFKADFDWLMVPSNFLKVFEGRYHERGAA